MSTESYPELASYQPKKFTPDGGFELSGVLLLIIGMSLVAGVMGALAYWISQYFYLIILFPIGIGFAIGIVGLKIIKTARIRNMGLVVLIGLIAGVMSMGVMHYLGYLSYQKSFGELSADEAAFVALPQAEKDQIISDAPAEQKENMKSFLRQYQATHSFWVYMDQVATVGVSISRHSSRGINLGYTGSIIYWIIEICFVAFFVVALVRDAAGQPYCTRCHVWKENRGGFTWKGELEAAKTALETGNLPALVKSICVESKTPEPTAKPLSLDYHECPKCHTMTTTELFLALLKPNKHGQLEPTIKSKQSYPGAALGDMKKLNDHLASEANRTTPPTT